MREFLHCYRPNEIDKSRGMYSFVPRSPMLKVIFETQTLIGIGRAIISS